jgi:hypothetical protein
MTRKSGRKQKKRRRKEAPKLSQPELPPMAAKPSRLGLVLTLLGLVLTIIGLVALLELFPRLSATPIPETDNQAFPYFTVKNDGYLKVTDVSSGCYLWHVAPENGAAIISSMTQTTAAPEHKLLGDESYTVPCDVTPLVDHLRLAHDDLALVIYYRPWPFTTFQRYKLIRFVGQTAPGLNYMIYEEQPSGDLEKDFENSGFAHPYTK